MHLALTVSVKVRVPIDTVYLTADLLFSLGLLEIKAASFGSTSHTIIIPHDAAFSKR